MGEMEMEVVQDEEFITEEIVDDYLR